MAISRVCLTMVGMIPIALCFGFLVEDTAAFVHNMFVLGIYGLLVGLVTFVWSML